MKPKQQRQTSARNNAVSVSQPFSLRTRFVLKIVAVPVAVALIAVFPETIKSVANLITSTAEHRSRIGGSKAPADMLPKNRQAERVDSNGTSPSSSTSSRRLATAAEIQTMIERAENFRSLGRDSDCFEAYLSLFKDLSEEQIARLDSAVIAKGRAAYRQNKFKLAADWMATGFHPLTTGGLKP